MRPPYDHRGNTWPFPVERLPLSPEEKASRQKKSELLLAEYRRRYPAER
jgi:hypothetical protein